jgi:hypothetical protein
VHESHFIGFALRCHAELVAMINERARGTGATRVI